MSEASDKDLESGVPGATASLQVTLNRKLSRAFLSAGMPVSFKVHLPPSAPSRAAVADGCTVHGAPACPPPTTTSTHLLTPWVIPSHLQDVTYTVVNSQNKKETISLLQNVGGYLLPGEMAALMG